MAAFFNHRSISKRSFLIELASATDSCAIVGGKLSRSMLGLWHKGGVDMALSDNIRKARERQGFSQEYIADKLSVSRQAVSKWETGQSEPSTQNLLQLAEILKVDANILLNESRERKVFAKENIEQKGLRTILNKRNTILLTASCVAQMAVFCVNQGQVSEQALIFKYITASISGIFMILLLANIWFSTGKATRNKLYARIFVFVLLFEIILILSSHYLGGLISLIISIAYLVTLIKAHDPRNN